MKTNRTYEQLEMEFAECARSIKSSEDQLKAMERQARDLTRRQRTKRLCTRGGMLEHFLDRPELLTDDKVMKLLTIAFRDGKWSAVDPVSDGSTAPDATITCTKGDLSSLLMNCGRLASFLRLGVMEIDKPEEAPVLDLLLYYNQKPFSNSDF